MVESTRLSGGRASRSTAALTVGLMSLVLGGWVLIWNDDGGGPLPVVLIHNVRASVPYLLTLAALAANVALPTSTPLRWIAAAFASAAALATLLYSILLLNNAGTINEAPLTADGSVDVDNAVTRAVNGQLTEVDPTFFSVTWGIAGTCLLLAALFEVSTLMRKR
jgi:hypothetical protein